MSTLVALLLSALAAEPTVVPLGTGTAWRFKGAAVQGSRVYLASWDRQELVVVDLAATSVRPVPTPYSGRLNAMGVHLRGERLFAVMNEVDDRPDARPVSALVMIDTRTETVLRTWELRGSGGRHHFNHVVVDARGVAYVSDTLRATVHTVDTTAPGGELTALVTHPDLTLVHGLDLSTDETTLFVTSYQGGVRFFDLERRAFAPFADRATGGDDGLVYHRGALYGVGKGMVRRHVLNEAEDAVVRTEVLLRDHPLFAEPRDLQVVDDRLYCLANIELAGPHGRLTDSHLVVLPL